MRATIAPGLKLWSKRMHSLYRAAQHFVSTSRLIGAVFGAAVAASILLLSSWIGWRSESGWFWLGVAFILGLWGIGVAYRAAELFLSTRPKTPPPRRPMSIETREDEKRKDKNRRGNGRS